MQLNFLSVFRLMVHADILVGSKSGMKHLAGLLRDQIKQVPKMWNSYRGTSHVLELEDMLNAEEITKVSRLVF